MNVVKLRNPDWKLPLSYKAEEQLEEQPAAVHEVEALVLDKSNDALVLESDPIIDSPPSISDKNP